ncbi:MAG: hypothetical protein IJ783_02135 [Kiritimatiellae bacterium]|nr:hypothetical protein [Kiritimatiellia bacterium]
MKNAHLFAFPPLRFGVAVFLCAAVSGIAASAATATWNKKAAGTYDWTDAANWEGGTLPTAEDDANFGGLSDTYRPAGNQTITGDGTAKSLDFHNTDAGTARTFTGDVTAGNLVLRVGTVNVDGKLVLTGDNQSYSLVGASANANYYGGTLDIRSGGELRADGVHAICVGRRASADNTAAAGRVLLRDGGKLVLNPSGSTAAMAGLMLGRLDGARTGTNGASYVQFGGEATIGRFLTGYEKNTFGTIAVLGGTLDLPYISNDTRFRTGHLGYGVFQLLGGDVSVGANLQNPVSVGGDSNLYAKRAYAFEIGSGNKLSNGLRGAHFYANAGSLENKLDFAIQGPTWDYAGVAPAYATIDGAARVSTRTMRVGESLNDGLAALNLNGGALSADVLYAQPGRAGRSVVNADGGKIVFPGTALQTQGLNLDAINVYEGGLEIECNRTVYLGNAATNVVLRTPGGYGVDVASVTEISSSFSVPWIEISGGGGSGAAAVALVDFDTSVTTNAVIACRGEGYAADDEVTATVYRPYGTTTFADRIRLSLSENKPGALVKTGGYNLALFAQPEFSGTYHVKQGWMIQATGADVGSPKVSAVVVGGDDAHFQCGSGSAASTYAKSNFVNPAASLTLGTADGPDILNVPAVANGETKPFEQTFASLSVKGTGNAIAWPDGSGMNTAVGTKLSFGTISCAEGSQITIPDPKSSFKVYCTGMPAGTALPAFRFAGDTIHTGVVADDGQIVPMPLAFVLVVR